MRVPEFADVSKRWAAQRIDENRILIDQNRKEIEGVREALKRNGIGVMEYSGTELSTAVYSQ